MSKPWGWDTYGKGEKGKAENQGEKIYTAYKGKYKGKKKCREKIRWLMGQLLIAWPVAVLWSWSRLEPKLWLEPEP
jgi:hypothetical protein